jgi:hypothetical protein
MLPTLEDMQQDDWPEKVQDWTMFWAMFEQWMYFMRASTRKKAKRFSKEHLAWLNLDKHDLETTLDMIQTVWSISLTDSRQFSIRLTIAASLNTTATK